MSHTARKHVDGVLLLYTHRGSSAATTYDHVESFSRYSRFPVFAVEVENGFPPALRSLEFSVIVLHFTLFGREYFLSSEFLEMLNRAKASYKIAFFQDDYRFCRKRFAFIDEYGINDIYTPIQPEQHDSTYGKYTRASSIRHTLTGYVAPGLVAAGDRYAKSDRLRSIDVGYRGRMLPYYLGRTVREKVLIGEEFARRAPSHGLKVDISSAEQDRIYGDAWYSFLGNCRASLGVESGCGLVDVEDEVFEKYQRLLNENPSLSWEDFTVLAEPELARWDGRIPLLTISPRVFEAAALRSTMILFEGRYDDIVQPGVHYIPLRKDFANFDEVVDQFRAPGERRRLTDRAYSDLIASGLYSYERFVRDFDSALENAGVLDGDGTATPTLRRLRAEGRILAAAQRLRRAARYRTMGARSRLRRVEPLRSAYLRIARRSA